MPRFHTAIAIAIVTSLCLIPLVSMVLFPLSDSNRNRNSDVTITKYWMGSVPIFLAMCKWVSWFSAVLFTTFTVYKLHFIVCKVVNMPQNQINRLCHWHRQQILLLLMFIEMNVMVREVWVHPLNDLWPQKGEFYSLYPDLRHFPRQFFFMYWMSVQKFDELLEILEPHLKKHKLQIVYFTRTKTCSNTEVWFPTSIKDKKIYFNAELFNDWKLS